MSNPRTPVLWACLALLAALPSCAEQPQTIAGTVVRVADGDTIFVDAGDEEWVEVRLYGVDCPESRWEGRWPAQPFSRKAKGLTISLALGKRVVVHPKDVDSYGRTVGDVIVGGVSLSRELLRAGLAWWNKRYAPHERELERLQQQAKQARRGLWSQPHPVPPWVHRHRTARKKGRTEAG